ncbi:MAG: heme ABC transporter ATP-binding protein [Chloroflexi bacterium]|nr:MAG: heme ABC transporter ATP-binding protein [Chloroflexota bacterium]
MPEPIVQLKAITKRFPGVLANEQVTLDLYPGEVHSVLGENGAGKTTLMSILAGLYQPDEGELWVKGRRVHFRSAQDAIRHGVDMVHQHFQLVKSFTVAENIILGQPSSRGPLVENRRTVGERIRRLSQQYRLDVDPDALIWQLSVGEQQRVEILKALYRGADVLVLDEPTAVLTPQEASDLLAILRILAGQGRAIVFISHKLNEVLAVSDRITVMRNGRVAGSMRPHHETVTTNELARLMVGREVLPVVTRRAHPAGERWLRIEDLWVNDDRGLPAVRGASLEVRAGEIVGLAGVAGNGQRELEEALRGLRPVQRGRILLGDQESTHARPSERVAQHFAHIPADRYGWGLLSAASVAENLVLETFEQPPYTRRGLLQYHAIFDAAAKLVHVYGVRTPSVASRAGKLSGGNAQKLVLARELSLQPRVLLAAQPTRGLDIGAISYVHEQLIEQRDRGVAILLISTELDEIFALSDRIAVLYEGRIVGETPGDNAYRRAVGLMMAGVPEEQAA